MSYSLISCKIVAENITVAYLLQTYDFIIIEPTLIISGVIMFGPMEENTAILGAGLVFRIVTVEEILPTGFLK